ncbi:MAG: F0F1 ATP synthase subunit B [Chloroflexi bacterium]|nr:F0F1 ATP synthase subunit B [Chloroflexota bacterium]
MDKLIGELGISPVSLIVYLFNFLVLLGLLYAVGYKPILRMLDQRAARIRESLDAAERARQESAQASQDVKARLDEARKQAQAILDQAAVLQERMQEDAREQARKEAQAIIERAQAEIERQRDDALAELRRQFVDLTIVAAERVINRSLDRSAHAQLIEEALQQADLKKG